MVFKASARSSCSAISAGHFVKGGVLFHNLLLPIRNTILSYWPVRGLNYSLSIFPAGNDFVGVGILEVVQLRV